MQSDYVIVRELLQAQFNMSALFEENIIALTLQEGKH